MPVWHSDDDVCIKEGECTSDFLSNVWKVGSGGWPNKIPDAFDRQIGIKLTNMDMWFTASFSQQKSNAALMKCYKERFKVFRLYIIYM